MLIQVSMLVKRTKIYYKARLVEVWGHVGDYEVMVCLSFEDARAEGIEIPNAPLKRPACSPSQHASPAKIVKK